MKRLLTIIILAILLVELILLGLRDKNISLADTSIPNDKVASDIGKATNSSASAATTITMTGAFNNGTFNHR